MTAFGTSGFASSLAVWGDLLWVGAYGDDENGMDSGAVYLYDWDGVRWTFRQKLVPKDSTAGQLFGSGMVAFDGGLFVTAPGDDEHGDGAGAVYYFEWDGSQWSQRQKLSAGDAAAGGRFGSSVAASESAVIIGATGARGAGDAQTGTAYAFRRVDDHWGDEQKLIASDGAGGGRFGAAVAIHGSAAILGAPGDGDYGDASGSAYLFRWDARRWWQRQKLSATDGDVDDQFGFTVGMSQHAALVGAIEADGRYEDDAGAVYVYGIPPYDCDGNGRPDECDIADGSLGDCDGNVIPDRCEPDCNGTGVADICEILDGTSDDCNGNRVADECELDCNHNHVPDDCDLANGSSRDCDGSGIPDDCERGCNHNHQPDVCDLADGTSQDCNESSVPDECEGGCNWNRQPDSCDIADGTSHDCNANAIPDECDYDCNVNGWADECDIAEGRSRDCYGAVGNCRDAHATPGCNDPAIETCVCDADPSCCTTLWNQDCVSLVSELSCVGCPEGHAPNGRPDECECFTPPYVVPGFANGLTQFGSSPCSGYIDPRGKSSNGVDLNMGITSVTLRFSEPVYSPGGRPVVVQDFSVTQTGGDPPPDVMAVEALSLTQYRLRLNRPIAPKEWTTVIAHVENACGIPIFGSGDGDRLDIGFLPGDVNQSGSVDMQDVNAFRQLAGLPTASLCGGRQHYMDTNRDGVVRVPQDLIRLRQLLAGTPPATRAWQGQSMNHSRP
ncbi:MAG: hypothetical protein HOP29_18345 [Phycisphaerales bacterium]|nr:hypothetical protein [Phycisphaerales bacterium]